MPERIMNLKPHTGFNSGIRTLMGIALLLRFLYCFDHLYLNIVSSSLSAGCDDFGAADKRDGILF